LNDARRKSEAIIDDLHAPLKGVEKKPRTYRKKARRDFLSTAKAKRLSGKNGERHSVNNWAISVVILRALRDYLKKYPCSALQRNNTKIFW